MNAVVSIAFESICVIAAVSFVQTVMLTFRNPFRPVWMQTEILAVIVSIVLVILIGLAVSVEVYGLTRVGFDPFLAMATAVALGAAAAWTNWQVFSLGARLRQADNGQSPFRLVAASVPPGTATGA